MNTIMTFLRQPSSWLWLLYLAIFGYAIYEAARIHHISNLRRFHEDVK